MKRRIALLAAILAGGLVPPAQAATLRVGSMELRSCGGAWCGKLSRPLNPARPTGRRIQVSFRWYAGRSSGPPLVAVEGGPGYPSTGSRVEYLGIYGRSLVRSRGLLLVDNRGTGASALIDCKSVQGFAGRTSGRAFARRVGRCAREIEARYGRGASGLFATAYAADDLAAVMRALRLGKVDLYGDSYGTYFVQDFIARYPGTLHSVVLDSAYPRRDTDPWYASSGAAARAALETVSAGSVERLRALLDRVRATPLTGRTRDADGSALDVRVDPRALADMVQDSGSDPVILRELDASVRAALAGDDVPLLRLAGQANSWNHTPGDAAYFSRGAYLAVSCLDYPQVPDLLKPPDAFQPFTGAEWRTISGFSQPYDVCLDWPRPLRRPSRLPSVKLPASVPILIVGGDLDSLTPLADAPAFGPALGANVQIVNLRNTVHVTSEGDNYLVEGMRCARRVIRSFLRGALNSACAGAIPALHTADYPLTLAAAAPATLLAGPDPGETARRAATVAAQAVADATIRQYYSGGNRGPALRGGTFTVSGSKFTLRGVRFVSDATVDGSVTFSPMTGGVMGSVTVAGFTVGLHWSQARPDATVNIGPSLMSIPAP